MRFDLLEKMRCASTDRAVLAEELAQCTLEQLEWLSSRVAELPQAGAQLTYLAPRRVPSSAVGSPLPPHAIVYVDGCGEGGVRQQLARLWPGVPVFEVDTQADTGADSGRWSAALGSGAVRILVVDLPVQQAAQQPMAQMSHAPMVALRARYRLVQGLATLRAVELTYLFADGEHPVRSALIGLLRTLPRELPAWRCKSVQVATPSLRGMAWLQRELSACERAFEEVVVDGAARTSVRWDVHAPVPTLASAAQTLSLPQPGSLVLITGGLGKIGVLVAEHLIRTLGVEVLLCGRSPLTPAGETVLASLRAAGGKASYRQADITRAQQTAALVEHAAGHGDLQGIVHCAGVLRDCLIAGMSEAELDEVLGPKVAGAVNLAAAVAGTERASRLRLFAAFSSLASMVGNPGQSGYAVANRFLDGFCETWRGPGRAVSINWPFWQDGAMRLPPDAVQALAERVGLQPLASRAALTGFDAAVRSNVARIAVLSGDADRIGAALVDEINGVPPAARPSANVAKAADTDTLRARLAALVQATLSLDSAEIDPYCDISEFGFDSITLLEFSRAIADACPSLELGASLFLEYPTLAALADYLASEGGMADRHAPLRENLRENQQENQPSPGARLRALMAATLALDPGEIDDATSFGEAGFDSISLTEFARAISDAFPSISIDQSVFLEHATMGALTEHLAGLLAAAAPHPALEQPASSQAPIKEVINNASGYEPIAVIGIGGRFPQADDVLEYWRLLCQGRSAIERVPQQRWRWSDIDGDPRTQPGRTDCHYGGFLKEMSSFDAELFNIAPVEAEYMDPQQRQLLEVVWATLDNAGYSIDTLAGQRVGTYVGVQRCDYIKRFLASADPSFLVNTGNVTCFQSGRIGHQFNFSGPNESVNAACTSSFIALHNAIAALQRGECDVALVGAANLLLDPWSFIVNRKAGMLTTGPEIRAFDRNADGQLYGEAAVAVMIKPLARALADGDHVYAVIEGDAINHDGRATYLTQPNYLKHEEVIGAALEQAGRQVAEVAYVEAQGAATAAVDLAELRVLNRVFGERATPLVVGNGKAVTGHMENASGLAALIKVILSFKNDAIIPLLHCDTPNWPGDQARHFTLADAASRWQGSERLACIHNYGYSGANACVVVRDGAPRARRPDRIAGLCVVPLSAASAAQLREQAARLAQYIGAAEYRQLGIEELDLADLAFSLRQRRAMKQRAAFVVRDLAQLQAALARFAENGGAGPHHAGVDGHEPLVALARQWCEGAKVDWNGVQAPGARRVPLPAYPFAQHHHWVAALAPATQAAPQASVQRDIAAADYVLDQHRVGGQATLPGAAYLSIVLAAAAESGHTGLAAVHDLVWTVPARPAGKGSLGLQVEWTPRRGDLGFNVSSSGVVHCQGRLAQGDATGPGATDLAALRARCTTRIDGAECYQLFAQRGIEYGPRFRALAWVDSGAGECLARVQAVAAPAGALALAPELLDAALQTVIVVNRDGGAYLPFSVDTVRLYGAILQSFNVHTRESGRHAGLVKYDIDVLDDEGAPLAALRGFAVRAVAAQPAGASAVGSSAAGTPAAGSPALLTDHLRRVLARVVKLDHARISSDGRFDDYGINSVLAVAIVEELERDFGSLPRTLLFECQSVSQLGDWLQREKPLEVGARFGAPVPVAASSPNPDAAHPSRIAMGKEGDIAIVGLAGSYPKSPDLAAFWRNLAEGVDCITTVPPERWDAEAMYSPDRTRKDKIHSKWGGFLADVDKFDPLFFNISPREAEQMDPQERLFLQTAWNTLEDAGVVLDRGAAQGAPIGVFVGVMTQEYQMFGVEESLKGTSLALPGDAASIANRVSFYCNLNGPSMAVGSMCSSSLTAIHLACNAIRLGECASALAGGVNLSIHPNKYRLLSRGNFISSSGHCESFGAGGDGYVPSEGVGCVLLKPLAAAVADGDHIHGVIKGSAINHGGRSNGYTVPNPNAQAAVIRAALDKAGVDAASLGYIEAHGTGTALGDPIEVAGLSGALGRHLDGDLPCALGSVKSNIGHCEAAAGVAGLTKVLLQLRHGQIAPSLHSATPNPNIDFARSRFAVPQRLQPWAQPATGRRSAGVSSFGAGGANAHLVIEEYPAPPRVVDDGRPCIVPLSAKTPEQLRARARALVDFLGGAPVTLAQVASTCQLGREPMRYRVAAVAATCAELRAQLDAWLGGVPGAWWAGDQDAHDMLARLGLNQDMADLVPAWLRAERWDKLATAWVNGIDIDWNALYPHARPARVGLPGYPFAKEHCWVTRSDTAVPAMPAGADPAAVPAPVPAALQTLCHVPYWRRQASGTLAIGAQPATSLHTLVRTLIIYGAHGFGLEQPLLARPGTLAVCLDTRTEQTAAGRWLIDANDPGAWEQVLAQVDAPFDAVYFLGGLEQRAHLGQMESLVAQQEYTVIALYRALRALSAGALAAPTMTLVVPTQNVHRVTGQEPVNARSAALPGFVQALAKEHPRWRVATADLCAGDLADLPAHDVLAVLEAQDCLVPAVALRAGYRYVRELLALPAPAHSGGQPAFRHGGVYVIAGGAGGLGTAFTHYLITRYQARVFWLGRRPADARVKAAIEQAAHGGQRPHYLQADLLDPAGVEAALATIKAHGLPVNGVIHSALVLDDVRMVNMREDQLRAVLAPKVDGAVALALALRDQQLDWVCMFSSLQSFSGGFGQANYAAASTFKDALAMQLDDLGVRTHIVNWGYWGEVGAVASEFYRKQMREAGFDSLGIEDGAAALETTLSHGLAQVAAMRVSGPAGAALGVAGPLAAALTPIQAPFGRAMIDAASAALAEGVQRDAAQVIEVRTREDEVLAGLALHGLAEQLQGAGWAIDAPARDADALCAQLGVIDAYRPWWTEVIRLLAGAGALLHDSSGWSWQRDHAGGARTSFAAAAQQLQSHWPQLSAQIDLLRDCCMALPRIVRGQLPATDVLFPKSSFDKVERIYRGNLVADRFNAGVAELVGRLAEGGHTEHRLRILEIGAGTGGTSAAVFERIAHLAGQLEYHYTDISKGFLHHADKTFSGRMPGLVTRLFNVEQPLADQGVEAGHFDIVIATNVLHATADLAHTLRQVKATLKQGGVLVLNEISRSSLYLTLTFGLTEGWWLARDRDVREPGSPGSSPRQWRRLLEEAGFGPVAFPFAALHELGQQLVVARSASPLACQAVAPGGAAAPTVAAATTPSKASAAPAGPAALPARAAVAAYLATQLAGTLKVEPARLRHGAALEEYGMDSILAVELTNQLGEVFGELSRTLFFEYQTIDQLAGYFLEQHADALARLLSAPASAAESAPVSDLPDPEVHADPAPLVAAAAGEERQQFLSAWDQYLAGQRNLEELL